MKRLLTVAGAVALLAWTGLGLAAWSSSVRRVTFTTAEPDPSPEASPELLALADELGTLRQDVRALAEAMGTNLQALRDDLVRAQDENAAALGLRMAALRDEVGSRPSSSPSSETLADLLPGPETLRDAEVSGPAAQLPPTPSGDAPAERAPVGEPVARPRRSFLAFQLPSDDFRFDERRAWTVVPALSRVGFDARTTLHDFSAVTSAVEGELEADLSGADPAARASIRVQAASLASGNGERDEGMREHLAVTEHPELAFELARFEPQEVDPVAQRAAGRAHGRMSVRGVTREVAMEVRLSIDDARRLCVEGEMPLDLTSFAVAVPSKLGVISMEKEVKVWVSLRLRAKPRGEG